MKEIGADGNMMGYALAVSTISEVPILFFGNRLLKKFGARKLMALAMLIAGARLLATAAFNTPMLVLLIQFVSGLTFPLMWMAGVSYTEENAPPGMSATAQGLFNAVVFGFGTAMGGFLGGLLLGSLGGRGMYFVFAVIVLVAVAIVTPIENRMSIKRQILPNDI
jgi:PPP family 3-phenylpropionic acid transporter